MPSTAITDCIYNIPLINVNLGPNNLDLPTAVSARHLMNNGTTQNMFTTLTTLLDAHSSSRSEVWWVGRTSIIVLLTLEVESNVVRVEVTVLLHLQASVLEDGDVVAPGRVGYVDRGPCASETR